MSSEKCECTGNCAPEECCSGGDCFEEQEQVKEVAEQVEEAEGQAEIVQFVKFVRKECQFNGKCATKECPTHIHQDDMDPIAKRTMGGLGTDDPKFCEIVTRMCDRGELKSNADDLETASHDCREFEARLAVQEVLGGHYDKRYGHPRVSSMSKQ